MRGAPDREADTWLDKLTAKWHMTDEELDEALSHDYRRMASAALDALTSDERRQVYGMFRIRAMIRMGGTLEVSGKFGEGNIYCQTEARSSMP